MPQIMILLIGILFLGYHSKASSLNFNTQDDNGVQTIVDDRVQTIVDNGVQTIVDDSVQTIVDDGVQTIVDNGVQTIVDNGVQTIVDDGVQTIVDNGVQTITDDSIQNIAYNGVQTITDDIVGSYTLKKGVLSYSNQKTLINKRITHSDLVIEKLDDDDYGFYLTIQVGELVPTEEVGIFHKKDNKYFKRIIYSPNITKDSDISIDSNIPNQHLKTELTDEVKITQKDNGIKIQMKVSNGGEVTIIWTKDLNGSTFKSKELKNAKHDYIETYKERFLKHFKNLPI